MVKLYLLLGGNLGDKKQVFAEVAKRLTELLGEITALSSIYETEPWGFETEDIFWNQVLEFSIRLSAEEVLLLTQQLEADMGRVRKENQYTSRIIDIDILFYGNQVINLENLVVPHPRIQERKFALIPLCEIASTLVHPVFQKSVEQLLNECNDSLRVEKVKADESDI